MQNIVPAFDMLFCQNMPIQEVTGKTGFSTSKLYTLKHRCLKKLKEIIPMLIKEMETPSKTAQEAE